MSLATTVPSLVLAALPPAKSPGKAYGVFVVSYNPQTGEALGGIAGTAFFISSRKAVTAFHVLQPQSFRTRPGFNRPQIWLVHEDQPAIELQPEDLEFQQTHDLTLIRLSGSRKAPANMVFAVTKQQNVAGTVSTEGFRVESTGPLLAHDGNKLAITAVPRLERLDDRGEILGRQRVDLHASDVQLQAVSCLRLSYRPVVGLSGGPVIADGQVVGMNSFADPGTRQVTWAVDLKTLL